MGEDAAGYQAEAFAEERAVEIAAFEDAAPPEAEPPLVPDASSLRPLAGNGVAPERTAPRAPGDGVACAAGFPLALAPEASDRYAVLDWVTEEGRAATIRYEFANGGLLEFTQSTVFEAGGDAESVEAAALPVPVPLPLPRVSPAKASPALEIAWQDDTRRYAVRSYGLTETEARLWIRSLETPRSDCAAPRS